MRFVNSNIANMFDFCTYYVQDKKAYDVIDNFFCKYR